MRSAVVLLITTLVLGACGRHAITGVPVLGSDAAGPPTDGSGAEETSSRPPAIHRATAPACPPLAIDPDAPCFPVDAGPQGGCTKNSDCTVGLNPRCVVFRPRGFCTCESDTCRSDTDCHPFGDRDAGACACNPAPLSSLCVDQNCRVDADCGPHGYCSPMFDACSKAISGYYCHTPKDTCIDDADCPGTPCTFLPMESLWRCVRPPQCQ
ncbi:MAG: hypothetical protein JWM82_498 [Myxococcales bacterium]|nr:hypothetical protein [Myxococcales bacterium]